MPQDISLRALLGRNEDRELDAAIEAVEAGARWFVDHGHPHWFQEIDLSTVDIIDHCLCPAGQVLGHYDELMNQHHLGIEERAALGFTAPGEQLASERSWSLLQDLWILMIMRKRRAFEEGRLD